jgi:hypothetical protein
MRSLKLTYTVEKTVEIDIEDFTLTAIEIENQIEQILTANAPEGFDDLTDWDCDWEYCSPPIPQYCQPFPPSDCWFEVDGCEWATNGHCVVNKATPNINDGNNSNPWSVASDDVRDTVAKLIAENTSRTIHEGVFSSRFAALAQLPNLEVFGESKYSPAYCWRGDRLIAILMPMRLDKSSLKEFVESKKAFRFNSQVSSYDREARHQGGR